MTTLNRPTSFPLAAKAHLNRYRACVYYDGGVFLVDCDAMSADEADRIGIYHFNRSDRSSKAIKRIESLIFDVVPSRLSPSDVPEGFLD